MARPSSARTLVALALVVAFPVWLICDTVYAWIVGWRVSNAMPVVVVGLSAVAVVALFVSSRGAKGRERLRRWLPRLLAMAGALVLSLAAGEFVVAQTFGAQIWHHHYAPNTSHLLRPRSEVLRGIEGESRVSFNSLGMRGDELPGDRSVRRILCVGGSTTFCFYLDDTETWPALLQRKINEGADRPCWVGNLGQNSYATRHHLQFTRYSPLVADVDDVVFLIGFNDFMRALLHGRTDGAGGVTPAWWRSAIYSAFEEVRKQRRREKALFEEDSGGGRYSARRVMRQKALALETLPDMSAAIRQYRSNVRQLAQHVRDRGARPVFATHPVLWRAGMSPAEEEQLWFGLTLAGQALSVDQLAVGMRAFNDALRAECDALDVACVDLTRLNGDPQVFYDDCHFTEAGADRVADQLATFFLSKPKPR